MKTILLARHGQASFGKDNYDKLSELGIQQAQILGQHYADTQKKVDNIVTGTLIRQRDSAKHFSKPFLLNSGRGIPVHTFAEFNEFDHEHILLRYCECDTMAELKAKYAETSVATPQLMEVFQKAMIRWHSGEHDDDYNESWAQFSQRIKAGFDKVLEKMEEGQVSLVFTSGGVIASLVSHLLAHPFYQPTELATSMNSFMLMNKFINTGVTTLLVNDNSMDNCQLLTINSAEHLLKAGSEHITLL